jgi:hypothetical protein
MAPIPCIVLVHVPGIQFGMWIFFMSGRLSSHQSLAVGGFVVHLSEAFHTVPTLEHPFGDHVVEKLSSIDAASGKLLSVQVAAAFPRCNTCETWRVEGSDEPLNDS